MVSRSVCGLWWFLGGAVEEEGERREIILRSSRKSWLTCWMIDRNAGAKV